MSRIGLYLVSIERQSYLIAKILALSGYQVVIYSEYSLPDVLGGTESPGIPERQYFSWLYSDSDIQMLPLEETNFPAVDLLIYEMWHRPPAHPGRLSDWMARASNVTAFHTHEFNVNFYHNYRADFARLVKYRRFLTRTRRFLLRGGRTNFRLPLMLAPGALMGYFVNPDFLRDTELRHSLYAPDWTADGKRPLGLLFAGNPEPPVRRKIVEELTDHLSGQQQRPMLRSLDECGRYQASSGNGKPAILWMVRGNPNDVNWEGRADSIHPQRWAGVLKSADFSVCPPGYELKTHRVIESLLCGSIPILDCPDEYDIGLEDGVNCLVAGKNTWKETVSEALNFSKEQIVAMRKNVWLCKERFLALNAAGRHLAQKCGLVL
ncbi:MAG TPA: hypothetical protein VH280_04520 [Verrucomicrobiae bacterium]|jgi:hypothetical protein|nr:hypothetical protein [Verrucomicrobiae bacterium]